MSGGVSFSLGGGRKRRKAGFAGATQEDAVVVQKSEEEQQSDDEPPEDEGTRRACERLADFIASRGQHSEEVARRKHGAQGSFRFLFDASSREYKYYRRLLLQKLPSNATDASQDRGGQPQAEPNADASDQLGQAFSSTSDPTPPEAIQPTPITSDELSLAASSDLHSDANNPTPTSPYNEHPTDDEPPFEKARESLRRMAAHAAKDLLKAEQEELHGYHQPPRQRKSAAGDLLPRDLIASVDPKAPPPSSASAPPVADNPGLGMHSQRAQQQSILKDEFEQYRARLVRCSCELQYMPVSFANAQRIFRTCKCRQLRIRCVRTRLVTRDGATGARLVSDDLVDAMKQRRDTEKALCARALSPGSCAIALPAFLALLLCTGSRVSAAPIPQQRARTLSLCCAYQHHR